MKNHLILWAAALFTFFFVSFCGVRERAEIILDLPVGIDLSFEKTGIEESCFQQINLMDSFLVLTDACGENFFNILSLSDLSQNINFGKGNYSFPEVAITSEGTNIANNLLVHDINNNVIENYKLPNLIESNFSPSFSWQLEDDLVGSNEIDLIDDGKIIGKNTTYGQGVFFIYNPVNRITERIEWIPYYPRLTYEMSRSNRQLTYDGRLRYSPENKKIVFGFYFFNRINIYHTDGTLEKSLVIGSKPIAPKFEKQHNLALPHNLSFFVTDIRVTPENIFVLVADVDYADIFNSSVVKRKLLVIDWKTYRVSSVYNLNVNLWQFAVDEKNHLIYGTMPKSNSHVAIFKAEYSPPQK